MTVKTSVKILVFSLVFFAAEWIIFRSLKMREALDGSGLAMVTAYKFLWLMIFTLAAGLTAPLGALMDRKLPQPGCGGGILGWGISTGAIMLVFTLVSFLSASKSLNFSGGSISSLSQALTAVSTVLKAALSVSATPGPDKRIADYAEFVGSKVEQVDSETLQVSLEFKNKSRDVITQIDYTFSASNETVGLISINMREGIFIPPGIIATSRLTWKKANFKEAERFRELQQAYAKGTLKIFSAVTRAVLQDGTVVGA